MQPFLVHDGREFYRLNLDRPGAYDLPFAPCPYPCLVWGHGDEWSEGDRDALVASLIGTDCRYAVCAGVSCEQWHDDIDLTFVATVPESPRFLLESGARRS